MSKLVRATQQSLHYTNTGKLYNYQLFRKEYTALANHYIDFLWNNKIEFIIKGEQKFFDILNDYLNIPMMLSNPYIEKQIPNFISDLSGRVRKACLTQVLGIIRSVTEKRRKLQYLYNKEKSDKLKIKLDKIFLSKPILKNINPELDSNCVKFEYSDSNYFTGYIILSSLGKKFGKIKLPIKFHRRNKKYQDWKLMSGFSLLTDKITFRWEHDAPKKKTMGQLVGCDQGYKSVITLSNGFVPNKHNSHNKSLESIIKALSLCKKNSNRFKKKQEERKNFVNWSVNQINLDNIKQINLEEIVHINYKKKSSRLMSHWCNTLIRDKLISRCEEHGVHVSEQSSIYRSQRCSHCGLVMKKNRKGKQYSCQCGHNMDADLNAAMNHEIELPIIPFDFIREKYNIKGFYWNPEGLYSLDGVEFAVPLTKN